MLISGVRRSDPVIHIASLFGILFSMSSIAERSVEFPGLNVNPELLIWQGSPRGGSSPCKDDERENQEAGGEGVSVCLC